LRGSVPKGQTIGAVPDADRAFGTGRFVPISGNGQQTILATLAPVEPRTTSLLLFWLQVLLPNLAHQRSLFFLTALIQAHSFRPHYDSGTFKKTLARHGTSMTCTGLRLANSSCSVANCSVDALEPELDSALQVRSSLLFLCTQFCEYLPRTRCLHYGSLPCSFRLTMPASCDFPSWFNVVDHGRWVSGANGWAFNRGRVVHFNASTCTLKRPLPETSPWSATPTHQKHGSPM
jgi:hypothetical protein